MTEKVLETTPKQAYQMLVDCQAILVDVRSTMEYDYVGHMPDSVLIPFSEPPSWAPKPDFLPMLKHLKASDRYRNQALLFICRSGHRSYQAASLAATNGFSPVYNVLYGFEGELDVNQHRNTLNGWRFEGLPWVQT